MVMTMSLRFFWGLAGSLALEVVDLNDVFHAPKIRVPSRYRDPFYWAVRLLLALCGGAIAAACEAPTAAIALNFGAFAPLAIKALSKTPPPS